MKDNKMGSEESIDVVTVISAALAALNELINQLDLLATLLTNLDAEVYT